MKIKLNDLEIELEPCNHCGAVPTEADAQAALKEGRFTGPICAICGDKVKLTKATLLHHSFAKQKEWLMNGKYEEFIDLCQYSGDHRIRATLHVACLQRVAPGTQVTQD